MKYIIINIKLLLKSFNERILNKDYISSLFYLIYEEIVYLDFTNKKLVFHNFSKLEKILNKKNWKKYINMSRTILEFILIIVPDDVSEFITKTSYYDTQHFVNTSRKYKDLLTSERVIKLHNKGIFSYLLTSGPVLGLDSK